MKRPNLRNESKEVEDARFLVKAMEDIDKGVPHWRAIARELERRFPELFGYIENDPLLQEDQAQEPPSVGISDEPDPK